MDKAPTRKVAGAAWLMTEKKNARQRHIATNKVIQARWKIEFMASRTVEVYGTITESTVNVFLHILYL